MESQSCVLVQNVDRGLHLPRDRDDVGCSCVIESLGHFGTDASVDAGKDRDQQRCFRLKNVMDRYSVVTNIKTGYEKPNSQHPLAEQQVAATDCRWIH